MTWRAVWLAAGIFLLGAAAVGVWRLVRESECERLLRETAEALADERFADAMRTGHKLLTRYPFEEAAVPLTGRARAGLKRKGRTAAIRPCDPLLTADSLADGEASVQTLEDAVDCLLDHGRIREAEALLGQILSQAPGDLDALANLAELLRLEGRIREARPQVVRLLQEGRFRIEFLKVLSTSESHDVDWPNDELYRGVCRQESPQDGLPLLSTVNAGRFDQDPERTRSTIESIVRRDPGLIEAQARLGWLLTAAKDDEAFLEWSQNLAEEAETHPQVWASRGVFLRRRGDERGAVRCLIEALRRDPLHRSATFHLGQSLSRLGDSARGDAFLRRAADLERLQQRLLAGAETPEQFREGARLAEALAAPWVAIAWLRELEMRFPDATASPDEIARLTALASQPNGTSVERLLDEIPAGDFPTPDWAALATKIATPHAGAASQPSESTIRFEERSESLGVRFRFHNGADPSSGAAYIFELSGGGVGVLDFDVDGWPDMYLTQGCSWPPDPAQRRDLDRLFRNVDGEKFVDVTELAGLVENGLSQSAAVADVNSDGFPDVYVGNIGANRLWLNNGDGSFRDATDESGLGARGWTSGAALADFNSDGFPDVYVVRYLGGKDLFTRVCKHDGSTPVQCSPTLFPAEQDRLYQNLGDGRFADVTQASGVVAPDGKGLAIVAADFDGARRINLFVANDTTPNFYFANVSQAGGPVQFEERGIIAGLAFNEDGAAQSCMGVAAGDADGDGRLDLHVTNFTLEASTLYMNRDTQAFVDSIRGSGLREASISVMGWGTQFLDADLDGREDLFVANGDLYPTSINYRQPAHFFRNLGQARFRREPESSLGEYFENVWLGRAVARIDLNRDGRDDLCVTHVGSPVALLVNQTAPTGRFLAVRLRGTVSERDAIGTTVRVTAGGRTLSRQLVSGDGFAVSNERQLIFGLGAAERVDSLRVEWPSGLDETFGDLAADRLLLVEGAARPYALSPR